MDDDPSGSIISVATNVHTVPESVGQIQISFLRSGHQKSPLDVDVTVTQGSAQFTHDFTYPEPAIVKFLPGQSVAQYQLTIIDDSDMEPLEDFVVDIDIGSLPLTVTVADSGQARVYILDNDGSENGNVNGDTDPISNNSTAFAIAALGTSALILVIVVLTTIIICKSRNSGSGPATMINQRDNSERNDASNDATNDAKCQTPYSSSGSQPMQQLTISTQDEEEYAYANVD
ncbi:uncharacterized protein [Amphiura filiformis]|uniref:uncharacterized protein isoform X2 n=1 Tax=Amphiura filiformis TaxID=82378 RepID=UPI003B21DF48